MTEIGLIKALEHLKGKKRFYFSSQTYTWTRSTLNYLWKSKSYLDILGVEDSSLSDHYDNMPKFYCK